MSTYNEAPKAKDAFETMIIQTPEALPPNSQSSVALLLQTPQRLKNISNSDTPYTFSSASQQGAEQTRRLIDHRVWEEIRVCTFRDAKGFFEKYFEDKDWSSRAQHVYESVKKQYRDNKWVNLADSPDQTRMLDWLFSLQDDLLSNEQHYYCTTKSTKELTGGEARRQIDLVVRRKNKESSEAENIRKDIAVIGELKYTPEMYSPINQPAVIFTHLLSAGVRWNYGCLIAQDVIAQAHSISTSIPNDSFGCSRAIS
jgi:hypothetical protein